MRNLIKGIATLAIAAGVCLSAAGCGAAPRNTSTITVSASHEVQVVPDVASIGVTILTEGTTPEEAQKANVKPTNAVIAKLKELGVEETSIQTTYTDLSPTWSEDGDEDGYQMQTRLTVSDLAVEDVSAIMDACVEAGATGIDGPDYSTGSYDDAYQEALAAAIEATRPKAEAIAEASGVTLGSVVSVTEGYQDVTYRSAGMAVDEATSDKGLMDIEPGQVGITAEVTVSYAIR